MLGKYEHSPSSPLTCEVLALWLVPGPPSQKWTWDSLQAYHASLRALKCQKDSRPLQASPPVTPPKPSIPLPLPPIDPLLAQA